MCRHCQHRRVSLRHSPDLCRACYQTLAIRRIYHPATPTCPLCGLLLASNRERRRDGEPCSACRRRQALPADTRALLDEIDRLQATVDVGDQECPLPTDALPGSPLKQAVLGKRMALGLPLWHPLDRTSLFSWAFATVS